MTDPRPTWKTAHLLASLAGLALAAAFYVLAFDGVAGFHASIDFNDGGFEDFLNYYYPTGRTVLDTGSPVPGFLYSPFFALLLVPIGSLGPDAAVWVWLGLQIAALLAVAVLPLALVKRPTPVGLGLYSFVVATSFPLVHNYHWGQVSVPLVALVLGALVAYERRRRGVAALLLACAISIKFYPAWFLVYFVLVDERRFVAGCVGLSALFLFALPAAVLGPADTIEFYRVIASGVETAEATTGLWADSPNKQVFAAVAMRLFGSESDGTYAVLLGLGWAWALGNVVLVWRRAREGGGATEGFLILFLTLPLFLSPSWPHYLAWLPFGQLLLARGFRCGPTWVVVASAAAASAPLFVLVGDPEAYGRSGALFVADLLLLAVVYRRRLERL